VTGTQIKIRRNGQGKQIVSARELYEKLGFNKSHWAKWYEKNILNNPFATEHEDWKEVFALRTKTSGGRPSRDFTLSIDFAKKICVLEQTGKGERIREYFLEYERRFQQPISTLPYHLQRYLANKDKIPYNCFSMINEITLRIIAPLEEQGIILTEKMLPDGSEGRIFCKWLRDVKGIDTNRFATYEHDFLDGRKVQAKLYPNLLWPDFVEHFHTVWLTERAEKYFKTRCPEALPYLTKMIEAGKEA
jgi:phage anti-repressor protein